MGCHTVYSLERWYGFRGRVAQTAAGPEDPRVDKPAADAVVGCFGAALSDEGVARSANRFYDYGFLTRAYKAAVK